MHPFWERLREAVMQGRLSTSDVESWFAVPYMTAHFWLKATGGLRGPWAQPENMHRLELLEEAVKKGDLPLQGVSAKDRRRAVRDLYNVYNERFSQARAAG